MKDVLNYKRFYKSTNIKTNVDKLVKEELGKGFYRLVGYSNEMDNFLNAVELDLIQEGFLSQYKKYCNNIYGLLKVFEGMNVFEKGIIEDKMVGYTKIDTNYSIVNN